MGKKMRWVMIFGLLSAFTLSTLSAAFADENSRYAEAASKEFKAKNGNKYLVVSEDGLFNRGLLKKLARSYEKDELCSITDEQLALISAEYKTNLEEMSLGEETVTIASVEKGIKKKELHSLLGTDQLDCKLVKQKNWFFLLFTPQIS